MRGYFEVYGECGRAGDGCPGEVVDLLFGSRLAAAKAELRLPLARALAVGGVGLPIEGFAFADAGVAWSQEGFPGLARARPRDGANRGWVSSAGVGARVNLFGFAVAEVNYVRPFEGGIGWHWQFALQPGF